MDCVSRKKVKVMLLLRLLLIPSGKCGQNDMQTHELMCVCVCVCVYAPLSLSAV